jgi:pullulanase
MPSNYFAPAERLASSGPNAPRELQNLVNEYHKAGIAVIMDVVYNHTANEVPHFAVLGGKYHHRVSSDGQYANAAGCGNEVASEHPMTRKMILDSKRFWMEQYHIDGTRDDLASIVDVETMRKGTRLKLHRGGMQTKHRFFTSEPWAWDKSREKWQAGDLDGSTHRPISAWDARYREGMKRFVLGQGSLDEVMTLVAGNVRPYGPGLSPEHLTKYLESHDDQNIADLVAHDSRRARLALGVLAVSQGPIMLGHAQEIMRGKRQTNCYNDAISGRKVWSKVESTRDVLQFASGLLAFRKNTPYFRYGRPLTESDITWLEPNEGRRDTLLGFKLRAPAEARPPRTGGRWPEVIVLANSDGAEWGNFSLPPGRWKVVTNGERLDAEHGVVAPAVGSYGVPPKAFVILSQLPQ